MMDMIILSAIAGLGAMGVTGLYQGAQAIKVKRGQNFIKKYEDTFKKTYFNRGEAFSHELAHHGIKGQKWGVRNYQNEDGSLTSKGREKYNVGPENRSQQSNTNAIKNNFNMLTSKGKALYADKAITDIGFSSGGDVNRDKTKKGNYNDVIKETATNAILNPVQAGIILAGRSIGALSAKVKTDRYYKNREKNSELDKKTGLYKKKPGSYSNEKEDLAAVNPGYKNFNANTKNNCMLCTTTYDLRQRGFDVTAQKDSEGYVFSDLKRWYPKAKFEKSSRVNKDGSIMKRKEYVKNTIDALTKQGDGARGNLMVWFTQGGGHSIVYEVKNGKTIIKDGQTGTIYNNPEKLLKMTNACSYARLDNIQPDMKLIKQECVQ